MKSIITTLGLCLSMASIHAQNVGINTTTPLATLHVNNGSVLLTGPSGLLNGPAAAAPPTSGFGSRTMWYSEKAAFRTGYLNNGSFYGQPTYYPDAFKYWDKDSIGYFSFANGYNTRAKGEAATALGNNTLASAGNAVAFGYNTIASGTNSFVTGNTNIASGDNSAAFGEGSMASGTYATAFGSGSKASGLEAFAAGEANLATNSYTVALGYIDTASGYASFVTGGHAKASGDYSSAIGFRSNATGLYSIAMGQNAQGFGQNSIALGTNCGASGSSVAIGTANRAVGVYSVVLGSLDTATAQFAVAVGYNSKANGNQSVAIGNTATTSGTDAVSIGSNTKAGGDQSTALGSYVATTATGAFALGDYSTSVYLTNSTANSLLARFNSGYKFYTTSTATVGAQLTGGSNAWSVISDVRKKEKFKQADGDEVLAKIASFKHAGSWNYKGQSAKTFRHYGPMAQEFYKAFGNDGIGRMGDDTTINSADLSGVLFIATNALAKRTQQTNKALAIQQTKLDLAMKQNDQLQQNNIALAKQNENLLKQNTTIVKEMAELKNQLSNVTEWMAAMKKHPATSSERANANVTK